METPTSQGAPLLHADRLSYAVGDAAILHEVSVRVARGSVWAVVGPSGSGKSTFLRLLNRLDEPTGGTVFLEGRDYRELAPRELRRRLGMVMQSAHLFPGTVRDNLRFGPRQRGEALSDERARALLEGVGLAGFAKRDVSKLSGGEAQRVSLARTLANEPDVLLLDEPTSALDRAALRDVEALVSRVIRERGLTALIVTHDHAQAERMADHVLVLERGRVARQGDLEGGWDAD